MPPYKVAPPNNDPLSPAFVQWSKQNPQDFILWQTARAGNIIKSTNSGTPNINDPSGLLSLNQNTAQNTQGQSNITHTGSTNTTGAESRIGEENVNRTDTTSANTNSTSRVYVDVPTPEEFLDDFHNGFAQYISNSFHGGGLPLQAAHWAMEHESLFLNNYLGELGNMASRGQPIFKPAAFSGNENFMGSRLGNVTSQNEVARSAQDTLSNNQYQIAQTQQQQQQQQQQTRTGQNQNRVLNYGGGMPTAAPPGAPDVPSGPFAGEGEGVGGGEVQGNPNAGELEVSEGGPYTAQPGVGANAGTATDGLNFTQNSGLDTLDENLQNTNSNLNSQTYNQQNNRITNQTNQQNITNRTGQDTEQVYSRDKLGYVHTLSPMSYLQGNLPSSAINIMYEGTKYSPRFDETGAPQAKTQVGGI